MKCKRCGTEVHYTKNRGLCDPCLSVIKEKERKTYGWVFYHLLNLKKKYKKIIIDESYVPKNSYKERIYVSKYGLQNIQVDRIKNKIKFNFYFGRSFCHRPIVVVDLNLLEDNKDKILEIIRSANRNKYINPVGFKSSSGYYKSQEGYYLTKGEIKNE